MELVACGPSEEKRSVGFPQFPGQTGGNQSPTLCTSMKIATYNINGVKGRLPALIGWLETTAPDVVCLREIKTTSATFPLAAIERSGCHWANSRSVPKSSRSAWFRSEQVVANCRGRRPAMGPSSRLWRRHSLLLFNDRGQRRQALEETLSVREANALHGVGIEIEEPTRQQRHGDHQCHRSS